MAIYKFDDLLNKHGVTADQVTTYGSDASIQNSIEQLQKKSGYVDRLKTSFGERQQEVKDINSSNASLPEKILQNAGQIAGGATDIVSELPGIKQGLELVGKGVAKIPGIEKVAETYNKIPERARKNIEAIGNVAGIIPVGMGAKGAVVAGEKAIQKTVGVAKAGTKVVKNTVSKIAPDSATIMNRVARLKPTDATKFEKLAGKTHGDYLKETGNFGTPDQIITREATKFADSVKSVDETLEKLPGVYKDGSISDALDELIKKAKTTSGENVKSPYLAKAEQLKIKHDTEGLSMPESNEVKRLFERNVKLGYNKLMNADKVEQATNIDNALRKWQFGKAKELGFENIDELNKQTQLSKFIVDKLGDQTVGKTGLNGVSLTDWVILSGGDPTAVAGFLTKKLLSSKGVQAKIAKLANKGEVKGLVTPRLTRSKPTTPLQSKIKVKKALPN